MKNLTIHEKAKKFDIIGLVKCVKVCPYCQEQFEFDITDFKAINMLKGLVYECPHCKKELILEDVHLRECIE